MTRIYQALEAYLSMSGLPVYLAGSVPESAALPYMTVQFVRSAIFQTAYVTCLSWFGGADANAARFAHMDALETLLPERGKTLRLDGCGYIMLDRGADFLSIYDDETDKTIKGARMALTMRVFGL